MNVELNTWTTELFTIDIFTIIAVALSGIGYCVKTYSETEKMKRELAEMMLVEVELDVNFAMKYDLEKNIDKADYFHSNTYDGIIQSTNIRYFSHREQEVIHKWYHFAEQQSELNIEELDTINTILQKMYTDHPGIIKKIQEKYHSNIKKIFALKYESIYDEYSQEYYGRNL